MICLQLDGASLLFETCFCISESCNSDWEPAKFVSRHVSRSVHAPGNPTWVLKCRRNLSSQAFRKDTFLPFLRKDTSNREITRRFGIDESTVRYNLKKMKETGSMVNKERSGYWTTQEDDSSSRTKFGEGPRDECRSVRHSSTGAPDLWKISLFWANFLHFRANMKPS